VRKIFGVVLLIVLVYAVSKAPGPWAEATRGLGRHLSDGAHGLGKFLTDLVT
jgi:hypothetical protein